MEFINRRQIKSERKDKIREKYAKKVEGLEVIPAKKQDTYLGYQYEKNVVIYVRVSTDDPNQTSSFELQKNYYTDIVNRHDGWHLINIYADEGISGTSLNHRDAFLRMIADCEKGGIDLIVVKSVSRFARNIVDCLFYVNKLRKMKHPVAVYFELEQIYTFNEDYESFLTQTANMAQEESHIKSKSMNMSIEMRFSRGNVLTPALLGYDKDEDGELVINEEEAPTVRLIFFLYLDGYTCQEIADKLTQLGRKTKLDNETWSASTVRGVLCNERHCGDVRARKTFTPDFKDHKAKKNNGYRNQYIYRDHHTPIISRDDFIAVQHMLKNAKYQSKNTQKSFLPELQVISEGTLKGFVVLHPTWAGFSAADYVKASKTAYTEEETNAIIQEAEHQASDGDFDLRNFEVVRSQFFDTKNRVCVTFKNNSYNFSTAAIRKLPPSEYVEILINPLTQEMAVRTTKPADNKYAIKWASKKAGEYSQRNIPCAAYINTVFNLFGWNDKCRYRINGGIRKNGDEKVLTFDMSETVIFVPYDTLPEEEVKDLMGAIGSTKKTFRAYPKSWVKNFGEDYYTQQTFQPLGTASDNAGAEIRAEYRNSEELNITSGAVLENNIKSLIRDMQGV